MDTFKIEADSEADAVYIRVAEQPVAYTREVNDSVLTDHAEDGSLIGVEFRRVSSMTPAQLQATTS